MADGDRKFTQGHLQVLGETTITPAGEARVTQGHLQVLGDTTIATVGEARVTQGHLQVLALAVIPIMGTVNLSWVDSNDVEDGHYIYKDIAPIDPENLPAPYATLGADVTTWSEHGEFNKGWTYYYRVAAFRGTDVRVSEEITVNV